MRPVSADSVPYVAPCLQPIRKPLLWVALAPLPFRPSTLPTLEAGLKAVDSKVIAWRRDFHQNPELSNREVRTAKIVAEHLTAARPRSDTGIAKNGVVGLLKTGKPGPTIALRADMDALPVIERIDVPFKSTAKSNYRGEEVGVMHACGHDSHTAMLMGVAEVAGRNEGQLRGNVLFVFQPAEEGAPPGEVGRRSRHAQGRHLREVQTRGGVRLARLGVAEYRRRSAIAAARSWRVRKPGRSW